MAEYASLSPATPEPAPRDVPIVIGQLGQSLDGRVATLSGESKYIGSTCALDHLHGLRAQCDAVLVGIGTVLADDPLLTVRRVSGASPARIVLDPSGRVPLHAKCLAADGARRIVLRREGMTAPVPPGVEVIEIASDAAGRMPPTAILEALRAAGLTRVLVEGGPATLAAFIAAEALDRLHVVVSPVILGSGRTGLDLAPIAALADARRPASRVTVFPDGDVLFDCDMRHRAQEADHASHTERASTSADPALCLPG